MSSLAGAPPPHCNAAFPSTRRTLRIHGTRTTPNPVELPGDPWHSQPLCFPHRTRAPRAIAPGAPARGLSFWRWCSLGRRRLGCALTAASGDSSSEPDHSPGSRPRRLGTRHRRPCRAPTGADSFLHCHQRRHSAPGLRAGRNRSTREDGLRPCFMKRTDQPNRAAPASRRPECPVSAGGAGRSEGFDAPRTSMNGLVVASRTAHRGRRGRTCRRPAGRGHDELRWTRSPRWRRTALLRSSPVPVDASVVAGVDV